MVLSLHLTPLFADAMQERRVTISASLFPRIISVDENISDKYDASGNVRVGLIYSSEKSKAENIAKLMTRKIKKIKGHSIVFEYIDINDIDTLKDKKLTGLFFVEQITHQQLKFIHKISTSKSIIYFSPFEGDIERGAMASIFVGSKIRPYFNLKSLRDAKITLKAALIKVSKTYE